MIQSRNNDFSSLQGYDTIIDQETGKKMSVRIATGEVVDAITATVPVGTVWITPEAMELIRERKEKQRAFFEKQDACKPLGSYIFVSTELSNSELKPATLARLVFLSTYVRYETNELYRTQRKLINIDDLPEVMRMSFSSVHRFMKEVCPQYIHILLDVLVTDKLQLRHRFMLFQVIEKGSGVIIVPLCGSGAEPPQITFHLKFFQTISCQHKKSPFHGCPQKGDSVGA